MWINIDFGSSSASNKKDFIKYAVIWFVTVLFNVGFSGAIVWLVLLMFGLRPNTLWVFVMWLVVFLLPSIDSRLKGGE